MDEATEKLSEEEQRDTTAALFGFIDEKARSDMDLREEEVRDLVSLHTPETIRGLQTYYEWEALHINILCMHIYSLCCSLLT